MNKEGTTNTILEYGVGADGTAKDGTPIKRYRMTFDLTDEDMVILGEIIYPRMPEGSNLADTMFACLTYGIHMAYEDATRKKFTLRMDRPKKQA